MQEHEYRARDKTVKKMSRDGLKEENLHSRKSIRVSNRETDDFFCATQAEDMEDFSKRGERAEDTKSAKKKLYSEKAGRTETQKRAQKRAVYLATQQMIEHLQKSLDKYRDNDYK